ncbi:MAG TPA: DUF1453 domain-containing protein [Dyella sp.]|uniref:DUF1453 domain-containing protein n=1 Tax=Dyella sp. TaxID=1869338 RepID=UPI002B5C4013|nr:DUF1453 domain-containing protein [Dyella sp.]HTV86236.1 DUF1453 domain-containing protein [Dyella sp.]
MAPHLTAPLVMIPLLAFAVWRRVRRQFGAQPIQRKRMILRIAIFVVLGVLSAALAMRDLRLIEGLAGGLVAGLVLGLVGLRLSRFIVDPAKGDCYVPNPYVGALVTVLFLGRLLWRFSVLFPQMQDPTGATPPAQGPAMGQSPLTLAIFGIFVAYYICYYAGLLIHHQRLLRSRPELAP